MTGPQSARPPLDRGLPPSPDGEHPAAAGLFDAALSSCMDDGGCGRSDARAAADETSGADGTAALQSDVAVLVRVPSPADRPPPPAHGAHGSAAMPARAGEVSLPPSVAGRGDAADAVVAGPAGPGSVALPGVGGPVSPSVAGRRDAAGEAGAGADDPVPSASSPGTTPTPAVPRPEAPGVAAGHPTATGADRAPPSLHGDPAAAARSSAGSASPPPTPDAAPISGNVTAVAGAEPAGDGSDAGAGAEAARPPGRDVGDVAHDAARAGDAGHRPGAGRGPIEPFGATSGVRHQRDAPARPTTAADGMRATDDGRPVAAAADHVRGGDGADATATEAANVVADPSAPSTRVADRPGEAGRPATAPGDASPQVPARGPGDAATAGADDAAAVVTDPQPTIGAASRRGAAEPIVHRILALVERLRTEPPPRQMVVDLEALGAGRLLVSLRGDTVVVGPVTGATSLDPRWLQDLDEALGARGWSFEDRREQSSARDRQHRAPLPRWRLATRADHTHADRGLRL